MKNDLINKRKENILHYIVKNHIKNGKPLSSLEISDSNKFLVSAATIRNDMKFLESKKLLKKSHIVGGRIPTTNGYKYFVKNFSSEKREINKIKVRITKILNSRILNIEEILNNTCKIISNIANITVIKNENNLSSETIKKIDLISLYDDELLLVLITNNGSIFNKKFKINSPKERVSLIKCVKIFDDYLINTKLKNLRKTIKVIFNIVHDEFIEYELTMQRIISFIMVKLTPETKIFGLKNLVKQKEISNNHKKLNQVIDFLENKSIFDILFNNRVKNKKNAIKITFGKDCNDKLDDFATITGNYKTKHGNSGNIGFFGTKRLEYEKLKTILEWFIKEIQNKY